MQAIEKKHYACSLFLDFAKTFHAVNHEILLSKLGFYGIRDTPIFWFKSYLSNRQQCFKVIQNISKTKSITSGVPQGSLFGPLLFLLHINDIYASTQKLDFHLFLQMIHVSFIHSKNKISQAKKGLDNISNPLKANELTLNVKRLNLIFYNITKNKGHNNSFKSFY